MGKVTNVESIIYALKNYRGNNLGGSATLVQLSTELGVAINTIQNIVSLKGAYAQYRDVAEVRALVDKMTLRPLSPIDKARAQMAQAKAQAMQKQSSDANNSKIKRKELRMYQIPYEQYFLALINPKAEAFTAVNLFSIGLNLTTIQRILLWAIKYDYLNWGDAGTEMTKDTTEPQMSQTPQTQAAREFQTEMWNILGHETKTIDDKETLARIHVSRFIVKTYRNMAPEFTTLPTQKGSGKDILTGESGSCYYGWDISDSFKKWLEAKNFIFKTPKVLKPFLQNYSLLPQLKDIENRCMPKTLDDYI